MLEEWTVEPVQFLCFEVGPHNPVNADKGVFESAHGVIVNGNFHGGYSGGLDDESDRVEVFGLVNLHPWSLIEFLPTSKMRLLIL